MRKHARMSYGIFGDARYGGSQTLLFLKLGFCGKIACTPWEGNVLLLPFRQCVICSLH